MTDEEGRIILQSGVEFALHMYRGQPEKHVPCLPTLGRLQTPEERLLALCRTSAFEDAIGAAPAVRVAEWFEFFGHPLRVDRQALAQHYGLTTDMLDFTSNFDVASFFAVCRWDRASRGYQPIGTSEAPGAICRTPPWDSLGSVFRRYRECAIRASRLAAASASGVTTRVRVTTDAGSGPVRGARSSSSEVPAVRRSLHRNLECLRPGSGAPSRRRCCKAV